MKKVRFLLLVSASLLVHSSVHAQYADAVVSYVQGTTPNPGHNNASTALGEPTRVIPGDFGGPVTPFNTPYMNSQVVSVGAGGSLTVQFNSPILNHPSNPYGLDFIIFGNAGFVDTDWPNGMSDGSLYGNSAPGSTQVSVSADNINYFVLNTSLSPLVDSLYPTDGSGNFQTPVNPSWAASAFAGQNLSGIRALYAGSGGGAGFDIAWASVPLPAINYIRVEVLSGDADIDGFSAVPEPTTWALLGMGAVACAFSQRRRFAKM